jgi:hypothetical protein
MPARRRAVVRGALLAVVALALLVPPAAGQAARRYSGRVARVELAEGVLVVETLGSRGRPERHAVQVSPETVIVSAARRRPHEMRGPSAFSEVPVELVDVVAGDFVVVETTGGAGLEAALRVTIVEPPAPPARR